jgi:hypothetical protein
MLSWARHGLGSIRRFELAGAVLGLLLLTGCAADTLDQTTNNAEEKPGPVLENLVARVYDGDKLMTVMQATNGGVDIKKQEIDLKSVVVSFSGAKDRSGEVSGDNGFLYLADRPDTNISRNDFVLNGHVQYKDVKGVELSAPELRYFSKDGKLVSGGGPFEQKIKTKDGYLLCTGTWFEVTKDLSEFNYHGNVQLKPDKNPQDESNGASTQ